MFNIYLLSFSFATNPEDGTDQSHFPALLLTYGRMTEDALCAESREAMTKITIESTISQAKSRLVVSYRGSVVWAFPLEECQTWTVSSKLPGLIQASGNFTDWERTFSRTSGNFGRGVWFSSCIEAQYMRKTGTGSGMGLNALARTWPSTLILGKPEIKVHFLSCSLSLLE